MLKFFDSIKTFMFKLLEFSFSSSRFLICVLFFCQQMGKETRHRISLCECGQPFQGRNFYHHCKKMRNHSSNHSLVRRFFYCSQCKKEDGSKATFASHATCMYQRLSKQKMLELIKERSAKEKEEKKENQNEKEVKARKEVKANKENEEEEEEEEEEGGFNGMKICLLPDETKAAVRTILPPNEVDESDEELDDFVVRPKHFVDLDQTKDSFSTSSSEEPDHIPRTSTPPLSSSTPCPSPSIRPPGKELASINRDLGRKLFLANEQLAELMVRMEEKEKRDAELKAELEESRRAMEKMMEEKEAMRAALEKAERELSAERKRHEKERVRLQEGLQLKKFELHIPLKDHQVIDQPLLVENLEQTMECYSAPEHGVVCLHATIEAVKFESIRFRRPPKKRLPSKYKTFINYCYFTLF